MFELGLSKLASMPTVLNNMHESLFRSYHSLRMIKELLAKGTPGDVVLAIISEIDNLQPLQTELVANKACTRLETGAANADSESNPAVSSG